MIEKLVPVDITFPSTEEGVELFAYVSEYLENIPTNYITIGNGIRYTVGAQLPEEAITFITLKWPHLMELDIDYELHYS